MSEPKFTRLVKKNFIISSLGLVDSHMFQHLYVRNEQGTELDVMENGRLSCAYVISSLLCLYSLIDRPHATVATTLKKMEEHGWLPTDQSQPGAVVYWPEYNGNEHIGMVIDETTCVSNSSKTNTPIKHGMTLSNGVRPTRFFVHPDLTDENT